MGEPRDRGSASHSRPSCVLSSSGEAKAGAVPIFPRVPFALCPRQALFQGHSPGLLSCQPARVGEQLGLRPRGLGFRVPSLFHPALPSCVTAEAAIRSVRQAQAEDLARVDVDQLEKVLPQLVGGRGRGVARSGSSPILPSREQPGWGEGRAGVTGLSAPLPQLLDF